ncbi:diguanylate cyclase [Photobacterium angustum]|uniref:diguanylate cyclase n=1 Tax=Photobacterium angustum TaxID=661 RepID=A0A2T3Q3B8_PHOAN|nr:GGDEF domain-containing protein [Photobacterium angustum]KJF93003.1 diguanylate cyclase [Photobacterium angustum]KJG00253.1 diguanylate cyclase [Photobacterium angustum]KJG04359.1 diguanylate cyclase [Photobacterium angustum]PQJ67722.1 GGDEF domain-containing protein [Photobacterium angustum]PSV65331.1 GGDEF domain-containing protein [Photobacterium angustum]
MEHALFNRSHSSPSPKLKQKPLAADQRLLILQKLQGKLEIQALFQPLCRELDKQIDISRLIWTLDETTTLIRQGQSTPHQNSFALRFGDNSLGSLHYSTLYPLDDDEISLLHTYHRLFAGPLFNAIEYQKVKHMALKDKLSGLCNRMCFEQDIHHAIAMSEKRDVELVLFICDLDNFKQVNDNFGHLDGDKVIKDFANALKFATRTSDRCYRIGGDEFIILLQPASARSEIKVASRINQYIQQSPILGILNIGFSYGTATFNQGDSMLSLIERADRKLYHHKRNK